MLADELRALAKVAEDARKQEATDRIVALLKKLEPELRDCAKAGSRAYRHDVIDGLSSEEVQILRDYAAKYGLRISVANRGASDLVWLMW